MTSEEEAKPTNEIKLDEQKEEKEQPPQEQEKEKENLDFKELYYTHPSQKDKVKKDFTEYSQVDMNLLNKKRERVVEVEEVKQKEDNNKINEEDEIIPIIEDTKNDEKNEDKNNENNDNNKKEEEIKENDLENNLPKELLDLIEERKDKEPFTLEDFEKYKAYKKLSVSFSK